VLMRPIATRRQTAQPNWRFVLPLAEPMTEAQEMLLENRLLGNVGVFREIRFQNFTIRVARRRDVIYLADPSERKERRRSMALNSLTSYRWHIYMSSNLVVVQFRKIL
jgi:hypothetical protein